MRKGLNISTFTNKEDILNSFNNLDKENKENKKKDNNFLCIRKVFSY